MEKSSQIAWKLVPLRHFFPLKVVPLIEVLLYIIRYVVVTGLLCFKLVGWRDVSIRLSQDRMNTDDLCR
jgi:hypothetical protein